MMNLPGKRHDGPDAHKSSSNCIHSLPRIFASLFVPRNVLATAPITRTGI
jgi:hypothetical protein